jgi:tRNA/tmRNA/rRNA uracil-C5-methylase (TrmA/RlmC/RlmD family)
MKFDLKQATADAIARHYAEFPDESPSPTKPETETGKQRASLNAYKHGLTGQIHVFSPEEHAAFEKHCHSIVEALAPVGALEQQLAQSIAENHWRLNRARAIEACTFTSTQSSMGLVDPVDMPMLQAMSDAKTWILQGHNIQLLSLYEQRIQRSIERSMAELRTLRAERKAARDQALEEALLLAQLAQSKGEKYDAAADFPPEILGTDSVFSPASINRLIDRNQRLNEARDYAKTRVNPKSGRQMPAAA